VHTTRADRVHAGSATLALASVPGSAGPEKIAFPANYKDHVLYATVDRYDNKQYRELYGTPDAVKAVREGKPIPSGTVLTLVQYKAQVDAAGNQVKDANGRFVKGDLQDYVISLARLSGQARNLRVRLRSASRHEGHRRGEVARPLLPAEVGTPPPSLGGRGDFRR
jgi:Cytochrome P460